MFEYIEDKLSLTTFLNSLNNILVRYNSNTTLFKVLLSPLFLICMVFLFGIIMPIFLVGLIVRALFILVDNQNNTADFLIYITVMFFFEVYLLVFIFFGILSLLYAILKLMSRGLGKTIYDVPMNNVNTVHKEKKEENIDENNGIYIINDDEYK